MHVHISSVTHPLRPVLASTNLTRAFLNDRVSCVLIGEVLQRWKRLKTA